jgi:hypothetical protein
LKKVSLVSKELAHRLISRKPRASLLIQHMKKSALVLPHALGFVAISFTKRGLRRNC